MKTLFAKLVQAITSRKDEHLPVTAIETNRMTPFASGIMTSDKKSIQDHLNSFKEISSKNHSCGLEFLVGQESDYLIGGNVTLRCNSPDESRDVIHFLKETISNLLTREEAAFDVISIYAMGGYGFGSTFTMRIDRSRYTTVAKYLDTILEACRRFDIKKIPVVQLSTIKEDTVGGWFVGGEPLFGILHVEEGYHEIVSLDYLVSLHTKQGKST